MSRVKYVDVEADGGLAHGFEVELNPGMVYLTFTDVWNDEHSYAVSWGQIRQLHEAAEEYRIRERRELSDRNEVM